MKALSSSEYLAILNKEEEKLQKQLAKLSTNKKHNKRLNILSKDGDDISPYSISSPPISCDYIQPVLLDCDRSLYESFELLSEDINIENLSDLSDLGHIENPVFADQTQSDDTLELDYFYFQFLQKFIDWIGIILSFFKEEEEIVKFRKRFDSYSVCIKEYRVEILKYFRTKQRNKYRSLIDRIKIEGCNESTRIYSCPLIESIYEFLDRISNLVRIDCNEPESQSFSHFNYLQLWKRNLLKPLYVISMTF